MYEIINIIIPVYNEKESICKTFSEIENKIKTPHKIFVVYDHDNDNTIPIIKDHIDIKNNLALVKNRYGIGALNAIKTGFDCVEEGAILVVNADLSDDLPIVDRMFGKINEGYSIVCGSRYMKGGKQIGGPWFKNRLSRLAGITLYHLAGLPTHDATNSFKMYTKKTLNSIVIESNGGFELGMEIVIKAFIKGCRITEIPSLWYDRTGGESKFKMWEWMPKYIYWYLFAIFKNVKRKAFKINKINEDRN